MMFGTARPEQLAPIKFSALHPTTITSTGSELRSLVAHRRSRLPLSSIRLENVYSISYIFLKNVPLRPLSLIMAFNPLARLTGTSLRICIFIASTIGFVLFGYDNGVFSGLIVNPWFLKTFNNPEPKLLGTVSATYNLGGFVGGLIAFRHVFLFSEYTAAIDIQQFWTCSWST